MGQINILFAKKYYEVFASSLKKIRKNVSSEPLTSSVSEGHRVIENIPNVIQNQDKIPFCHQVWQSVQEAGDFRIPYRYRAVEHHSDFNAFNYILLKGRVNYGVEQKVFGTNKSVKDIIIDSDLQFKQLRPIAEKMTVYRCVGEKPEFFEFESMLYKKAYNSKPGDVITMPEYAYAAGGQGYAGVYKGMDGRGIMYEIEVPKNARVSHSGQIVDGKLEDGDECVFPRCSKFLCLGVKDSEDGIRHIKLEYILPEEPWRTYC